MMECQEAERRSGEAAAFRQVTARRSPRRHGADLPKLLKLPTSRPKRLGRGVTVVARLALQLAMDCPAAATAVSLPSIDRPLISLGLAVVPGEVLSGGTGSGSGGGDTALQRHAGAVLGALTEPTRSSPRVPRPANCQAEVEGVRDRSSLAHHLSYSLALSCPQTASRLLSPPALCGAARAAMESRVNSTRPLDNTRQVHLPC